MAAPAAGVGASARPSMRTADPRLSIRCDPPAGFGVQSEFDSAPSLQTSLLSDYQDETVRLSPGLIKDKCDDAWKQELLACIAAHHLELQRVVEKEHQALLKAVAAALPTQVPDPSKKSYSPPTVESNGAEHDGSMKIAVVSPEGVTKKCDGLSDNSSQTSKSEVAHLGLGEKPPPTTASSRRNSRRRSSLEDPTAVAGPHMDQPACTPTCTKAFMEETFFFLEHPDEGVANQLFNYFYNCLIMVSVLIPIASTLKVTPEMKDDLDTLNTLFVIMFTVEMTVKVGCCPAERRAAFMGSYYTMIDFLVVIAGYINLMSGKSDNMWVELISTMVPILRLLKITRHSAGWRLLIYSMKQCWAPLRVPFFLMFLMVVFTGSLHFWIDGHFACGAEGSGVDPSTCDATATAAFASIPEAMWFVLVTMSTVGYGDIVPHTAIGKVLASLQIVAGISYMAMPLSIIGSIFTDVWSNRNRLIVQDKLCSSGMDREGIKKIFDSFDADGSGSVELEEFTPFIQELNVGLSERQIKDVFNEIDEDKGGSVDFEEFANYLLPEE
eukprot:TRINITY_DN45936_c0_g1_i1.p1 TRINITY_DN45936_c0_g1~~TRINITY_DN45936_c0_g1_i1.p1  ORF type:complete len:553 (+),score=102.55 TRINITY_DN45936_c0_g1_i1:139-1797(+)